MIESTEMIDLMICCINFVIVRQVWQMLTIQKWFKKLYGISYFNFSSKKLIICILFMIVLFMYANGSVSLVQFLINATLIFWLSRFAESLKTPKSRKETAKYIYYLYKFLIQQITAGVRTQDALSNMYIIVEDQNIREVLRKFSAAYQSTYDFSNSKKIIEHCFSHEDAVHFGNIVDEGIKTGDMLTALSRQEKLIFNKYIGYIEENSYVMRIKLTALIVINCFVMSLWIALPIILDFVEAAKGMFL